MKASLSVVAVCSTIAMSTISGCNTGPNMMDQAAKPAMSMESDKMAGAVKSSMAPMSDGKMSAEMTPKTDEKMAPQMNTSAKIK